MEAFGYSGKVRGGAPLMPSGKSLNSVTWHGCHLLDTR